jgi:hypothetical protein
MLAVMMTKPSLDVIPLEFHAILFPAAGIPISQLLAFKIPLQD